MLGLKILLLTLAGSSGAMSVSRALHKRYVRILAYHGVDWLQDPVINWDGLQVRPRIFRMHLELLASQYVVKPLSDVLRALVEGEPMGENVVAITFDDGYRNNLALAAPMLKEFGFPATFFVSTGFVDGTVVPWWYELRAAIASTKVDSVELPSQEPISLKTTEGRVEAVTAWERFLRLQTAANRNRHLGNLVAACGVRRLDVAYPLLDRAGIRKLSDMGFEVGPHTVSHISMSHEDKSLIEREIRASIAAVTETTGKPVLCYSYPYGSLPRDWDDIQLMMKRSGVQGAVTTMEGMNRAGDDVFRLRRLNVSGHRREAFAALLSGLTGMVHKD